MTLCDNSADSNERLTICAQKKTISSVWKKKIIKLLQSQCFSTALWMVICSLITVLHVLTLLYSLYILYVPSPLAAAWPTNFHFCWYCNAPECSTRPGCCVFQRLPRGSPGIVCEEESYRRICTRLELPTVTFLFCHRIFFFFFCGCGGRFATNSTYVQRWHGSLPPFFIERHNKEVYCRRWRENLCNMFPSLTAQVIIPLWEDQHKSLA